jgi:methylenetetrahydrofolate--tRNA-(uracil-5-)-methyltransferase
MYKTELTIIGGGLAGSEAAWQAAQKGIRVQLVEMRPKKETGAHVTDHLAELVCSNSLGSNLIDRASGLLKEEIRRLDSLLIKIADSVSVPAGTALAVDRVSFSERVTEEVSNHRNINISRKEATSIPDTPTIIASGPLTSPPLSKCLIELSGEEQLFFYDAISPIVTLESINMDIAFKASRYGRGDEEEGDYINCPMNENEYIKFVDALKVAKRIELREFEMDIELGVRAGVKSYFEGCLPLWRLLLTGVKMR